MTSGMWTPLDREKRQIRLVHLAPSQNLDEQPSCSLHVVSLNENPQYEALSYTWGDPTITIPIQLRKEEQRNINQIKSDTRSSDPLYLHDIVSLSIEQPKPLMLETIPSAEISPNHEASAKSHLVDGETYPVQWPVIANLEAALRYLRRKFVERILWIDAICIDQSNIEERNHQVPLMKTIFSNAVTVQAWLGMPSSGSDNAIEILQAMGQGVTLQEIKLQDRLINDNDLQSVIDLNTRPWWNRTWIQQELLLAKQAFFHCGFSSLEWSRTVSAPDFLNIMSSAMKSLRFDDELLDDFTDSFDAFSRIQSMVALREQGAEISDEDYVPILAQSRTCHHSDERDSVYGFLGLLSENIASRIKPDYNLSPAEVFQDAAIHLTICSQSLIIFSLTRYRMNEEHYIPTWVPSWHTLSEPEAMEEWDVRGRRMVQHDYFSACRDRKMVFEVDAGSMLKLSGAQLDHVICKGNKMTLLNATLGEILKQSQEWRFLFIPDQLYERSRYIAGGNADEAYWRTILNDMYSGRNEKQRRCQTKDHQSYLEWLDELENTTATYWESENANSFHVSFTDGCMDRRFFVTKKGYIGIGPAELKEGDEIYVVAGGKHPFALRRPSELRPDTFELVGDCYVHGMMDGQATSCGGLAKDPYENTNDEEFLGGQQPDPDLPLQNFHDIFLV